MIPDRYTQVLPPYWYENEVANYHFTGASSSIDDFDERRREIAQQFIPYRATWGLDYWDWLYFGKKQTSTPNERRRNLQRQHWAYLGFTPSVLRAIGLTASPSKKVEMVEDFEQKVIRYAHSADESFDYNHAILAVEKIRPVHCNGVAFEPVSGDTLTFTINALAGMKSYHTAGEFRVGMTPIKWQEEVSL
ncbi:hypothetical protein ACAF76_002520 [Brevibacillus sp. TJ4]|uniref:hypothetical protein n=1 Tax=Brevibacillus sp. TJ4 TaxID=3234853 RepID=UPI0037D4662E